MNYQFCAQTDPGRVRQNNEDSVAFDEALQLAVLADGLGGYNAGEVASGMAVELIKAEMARYLTGSGHRALPGLVRRAVEICVAQVNRAIFEAANSNSGYAGMGTTLVVGVFLRSRLILGHAGDSRCYRWRGNELKQITHDHSLLQEQIDAGWLTPAQAAVAPNRNLVTRALGVEAGMMLELHEHTVAPDDIYLMCSDGLSDMLDDAAIAAILLSGESLAQMAQRLVDAANAQGGRDNITVLFVQAQGDSDERGLISKIFGQ